jgi:FSR family fosmidomycin resistance protein-like MFS transporter
LNNGASGFGSRRVVAASVGHFVHDVFTAFLPPLMPLLIAKFSLNMVQAGLLSVFLSLVFFLNPLLGILADRRDLRYAFIAAPALVGVCMGLMGAMPSYYLVCALLLVAGAGSAVYHTLGPVVITRASGRLVGRGMSYFFTGGELARTLGPLAAVGAVAWLGFEHLWPMLLLGLATSAYLLLVFKDTNTALGAGSGRDPESLRVVWRALKAVMLPLVGLVFTRSFVLWTLMIYTPTYLVSRGHSVSFGGTGLAVMEMAGVAGAFLGGLASDRWGRRPVLLALLLVSPLLMLAFNYSSGWLLWPVLVVLGLSVFSSSPVLLAMVQDHAAGRRGAANGLYMGMGFAVSSLVLVLVGWLVDLVGFRAAFNISAVMGLLSVPFALRLPAQAPAAPTAP